MLDNVLSLQIFFSITFIKIIFQDNISVSNSLDPAQPPFWSWSKLLATTKLAASRLRVGLTENTVSSFACVYEKILLVDLEYYCFKMMLIGVLIRGECEIHTSRTC